MKPKRLCWTDAKKLCVHGVRLTEACKHCAAAVDDEAGWAAWDGVKTEWRTPHPNTAVHGAPEETK